MKFPVMNIFNRIISIFYQNMFISKLYETNVGIKNNNEIISSDIFELYPSRKFLILTKDELYLSFDALKDQYTLLGTSLVGSPHYNLVKAIIAKNDLISLDYLARAKNGTLDILPPANINAQYIRSLTETCLRRISDIKTKGHKPIKVTLVGGKYYVADGKHRAAICAVLDIPIRCIDITPLMFDSYLWWVYKKMLKNKSNYQKHIQWFSEAKEVLV